MIFLLCGVAVAVAVVFAEIPCCFADDGKEMDKSEKRTCKACKAFSLPSPLSLLKFPNNTSLFCSFRPEFHVIRCTLNCDIQMREV